MRYLGFLEKVSETSISGWAIDTETGEPAVLSIFADDAVVTKVKAAIRRPDVERKHNTRCSGFLLRVSGPLLERLPKNTTIRVEFDDGTRLRDAIRSSAALAP